MNTKFELKHKEIPAWLGILMILGVMAGIIILTFVMYLIQSLTGVGGLFYVEFVLLTVFAVWYARTRLITFIYYLNGDILRIDRIYSRRPKLDNFIRMDKIIFMGKLKNLPEKYKKYKLQRETFKRKSGESFCVVHMIENKYFTALLSPSKSFEDALIETWKQYTYQPKKAKKK